MVKRSFPATGSITYYQNMMQDVYGLPGDRNFSLSDILSQQQRFTMRALKGIRKNDSRKLQLNLLNSLSWLMTLASRLHFDVEDLVWDRFPMQCSYCGKQPCVCKKIKPKRRSKIRRDNSLRPDSMADFQKMFALIYPAKSRTLADAGVHLAEEMGEVSEAVHAYLTEHKKNQLINIQEEIADCVSCIFGVANSAGIDVAKESARMFSNNCFVCHALPCRCQVASINKFKS